MSLKFIEKGHKYESLDDIIWTSVTSFINMLKPPFDKKKIAEKCSKSKRSKWYGLDPQVIMNIWEGESQRALDLGNWYHDQRESDMLSFSTIEREGVELSIIKPIIEDGVKYAPEQKIEEGVFPEHFAYLKSAGLCGQADLIEIVNGKINITDYKTNKEIKEKSYVNWEGISSKMYAPVSHLDDCNINHYNLQLSLYAYMINKHNPKLKVGSLKIQHVQFENEGLDEYGYPIAKYENGDPIIKKIKMYELPYLKDEVRSLIMWFKDKKNANKII